jgi:hypothetical protein
MVVKMTKIKVVVMMVPRSLKVSGSSGILSTSPKAIAPLIIPPYEMKHSSLIVMSDFF